MLAEFEHSNANEELSFEASTADGSPLPEWLKFNPKQLRFTGKPPKGAHNVEVMVTTKERYGNKANGTFKVQVNKERIRQAFTPKTKLNIGMVRPDDHMLRGLQNSTSPQWHPSWLLLARLTNRANIFANPESSYTDLFTPSMASQKTASEDAVAVIY